MKKLMIGLALTAMAAAPALADSYSAGTKRDKTASGPQASQSRMVTGSAAVRSGSDAYAYEPAPGEIFVAPGAVFANGEYQGVDPDPNIRLQLLRDPPTLLGNGGD